MTPGACKCTLYLHNKVVYRSPALCIFSGTKGKRCENESVTAFQRFRLMPVSRCWSVLSPFCFTLEKLSQLLKNTR